MVTENIYWKIKEIMEDRKFAAQKIGVDEENIYFLSIWDFEDEYLYLWNVIDKNSSHYQFTISGNTYKKE